MYLSAFKPFFQTIFELFSQFEPKLLGIEDWNIINLFPFGGRDD